MQLTTNMNGMKFCGVLPGMQPITTVLEPAPSPVMVPMLCLEWVVLDIETKGGDPNQVWEWVRRNWWPNEDWKPETMAKRLVEAVTNKREKLALLDSAEIATIQVKTSAGQTWVFHTFGTEVTPGPGLAPHNTERDMLTSFAQWLELNCGEGTMIVGWNIKGFDLPRLRMRLAKNKVRIPRVLTGLSGVLDLMKEYAHHWSVERSEFVSLSDALDALGMENHKKETDGSLVGELIERKDYKRLLEYGAMDVEQEAAVFMVLTGQAGS